MIDKNGFRKNVGIVLANESGDVLLASNTSPLSFARTIPTFFLNPFLSITQINATKYSKKTGQKF